MKSDGAGTNSSQARRGALQLGLPLSSALATGERQRAVSATASVDASRAAVEEQQQEPQAQQEQLVEDGDSSEETTNKEILVKFLVNTAWATAIIGRGGENIKLLMASSGAHVQLSAKDSYYPGTRSRVLLLRGNLTSVEAALKAVLQRRDELPKQLENPEEVKTLSMLVPVVCCGQIMGPGASNLAILQEESGASIALTSREKQATYVPDRTVRITGSNEQVVAGVLSVLDMLLKTSKYSQLIRGLAAYRTVALPVPKKAVGVIMGKGGESIVQLQSVTGVSMTVSPSNGQPAVRALEGIEGPEPKPGERVVTVSGIPRSVGLALLLLEQKVAQVVPRYRLPAELAESFHLPQPPAAERMQSSEET